ncbi:hypothetical protein OFN62_37000, partial [Escherichia coli]|nr:hypothetical protein [Escherichia coli]
APFDVDMSLVAKAFDETFGGEYHIDSLEHPVAQALLENKGEFVDVVDGDTEQKPVSNDDADDERVRDPSEDGIFSDDPEPLE